jgi:hypothetical protein
MKYSKVCNMKHEPRLDQLKYYTKLHYYKKSHARTHMCVFVSQGGL